MALLLPRFISLGFQGKYLECVEGDGDSKGLIEFSGEDVFSPKARIEVENAICSDELVHLKCCYRNKYLRRRSEDDDTIVAVAPDPDEDQSKWSCTLFRPRSLPPKTNSDSEALSSESQPVSSSETEISSEFEFEIIAPFSEGGCPYYLFCTDIEQEKEDTEEAQRKDKYLEISSRTTAFTVTNTEALVRLPPYILLKADNGKYMKVFRGTMAAGNGMPMLPDFEIEEEDIMDAAVITVLRRGDGAVRLRYFEVFGPNFLRFDGSTYLRFNAWASPHDDLRTWFRPVKLGTTANSFGLRLLSNNMLAKRHSGPDRPNAFGATSTQIEAAAVLEFEEAVGNRSIHGINYRMEDRKLYDFAPVTSVTKDVKNESQTTQSGQLTFTYTETKSETWGNMDSWGVGVKVEMKARIPFVGKFEVGAGAEYEGEYEWGEAKETSIQVESALEVEVPPMSRTEVTMIVSRGTLEVPFTYTQRDTLLHGHIKVTEVDGGLFSGVNTYVSYETTQIPI